MLPLHLDALYSDRGRILDQSLYTLDAFAAMADISVSVFAHNMRHINALIC